MGSSTKTLLYRYDAVGNRVGLTDGDGGRFTYVYDAVHRLSRVINPQGDRTTFSYDAAGRRREKALANGTRASFTYDLGNRLSRVLNLASGPTTLSSFDYRYDKSGNRTVIIEGGGSSRVTYSYDGASRLVGEHRTGGNPWRNTFSYDSRGNRTLKNETGARTTSVYDAANQLVSSQEAGGRTTYTFDANGNQARVLSPSGDRTTTSWDYENKTTLVRLPAGVRNTMSYNPQGLRVVLADSGGVRKFVWDEEAYLAETDGSDDTQVVYTQEPGLYGRLISQRRGGVISYHHYDGLGSTRRLTNVAQSTTDTYLYDAWGSLVASTGSTINPFRYVGELGYYYDPDTAHSYIRARIYAPVIARWTSAEPLEAVRYRSHYIYCYSNPLILVDPAGLQTTPTTPYSVLITPTYDTLSDAKCGATVALGWVFRVKGISVDGYLIQEVTVSCSIQPCTNCDAEPKSHTFYEVWRVLLDDNNNAVYPDDRTLEAKPGQLVTGTDVARGEFQSGTCGSYEAKGEVRFFLKNKQTSAVEMWGKQATHGMDTGCPTTVGDIPSSSEKPAWWDTDQSVKLFASASRSFAMKWVCCPCKPEAASANGEPRKK